MQEKPAYLPTELRGGRRKNNSLHPISEQLVPSRILYLLREVCRSGTRKSFCIWISSEPRTDETKLDVFPFAVVHLTCE